MLSRSSLHQWASRSLDGFVERSARRSDDPHLRTRAQLLVLYAAISAVAALVWSLSHLQYGSVLLAAGFLVAASAIVVALGRLWVTGDVEAGCRHALWLSFATTIVATCFTGGLRLTNVCAFFALFLNPVFLLGRRGLSYSLTALAVAFAVQVAEWTGFVFPDLIPPEGRAADAFMTWLQAAVLMIIFALLYDAGRSRATDKMRAAMQAKATLLANLSHEIRTPLHVIMGTHRALISQGATPTQTELVRTAQDNAESLLAFFDDLIDLARIEHRRFALRPIDFEPVAVLGAVARIVRHFAKGKDVIVREVVAADVARRVHGDERRIRQVLLNLGINASKFTERGQITLRLARGTASPYACDFVVEDTGIGIEPRDRERIFDSFTQVDDSPARRHDGAGLGLAISRALVRQMGGEIRVASTPGVGSSFAVSLPCTAPRQPIPASSPSTAVSATARGGRVLVIEDLDVNRELARVMLEQAGFEVVLAAGGAEALARWHEARADLVLLDIQMPGMDGFEVSRQIRAREAAAQQSPVPIIALTGRASDHDRALCVAAGMSDCLFKPFDAAQLATMVQRHLDGARSRDYAI